jgi:alkylhydroperoxidase family enzyme
MVDVIAPPRRTTMARTPRIPSAEITGPLGAVVKVASRRMLGRVPDSLGVMWNSRPVLAASARFGRKAAGWSACSADLKTFAHMATAASIGCSACLDMGYYAASNEGLDLHKASQVPRWREADVFTPLEREVMAYAEAVSASPPAVTDEQSARLLDELGPAGLLELTAWIGFANLTARMNTSLGIESEGLSDACAVPLARASTRPVPA